MVTAIPVALPQPKKIVLGRFRKILTLVKEAIADPEIKTCVFS